MTKYKRFKDCEECELCGSDAPLVETETMDIRRRGQKQKICEVCHTTQCGSALDYNQGDTELARMLAQVANLLLDKLDQSRR